MKRRSHCSHPLPLKLHQSRVGLVGSDCPRLARFLYHAERYFFLIRERLQCRERHEAAIDFKEVAQFLTGIAATETIRTEHVKRTPHLGTKRLDKRFDVVAGSDYGRFAFQNPSDIALTRLALGIQKIPAHNIPCLARELSGTRQAVDLCDDA